jgi:hypothetical protein
MNINRIFVTQKKKIWDVPIVARVVEHLEAVKIMGPVVLEDAIN